MERERCKGLDKGRRQLGYQGIGADWIALVAKRLP
jgi:hypothetical protein